jgi:hypothetical protein
LDLLLDFVDAAARSKASLFTTPWALSGDGGPDTCGGAAEWLV